MKIVQLITHMNEVGGAQVHVRDLSKQLVLDGHSVTIVYGGEKEIANDLLIEEIRFIHNRFLVRPIHPLNDFLGFLQIRRILRRIKPDIVAIHSSKAGIVGRVACWSTRTPSVFTAHGWSFTEGVAGNRKFLYRNIEGWVGRLSKKVITVCDYDRNLALRYQVLPSNKIRTIHNGVLDTKNSSHERGNEDVVKILMVARFEIPKQQMELLEALMHMKDLNWHMIFVGDGSLKQACAQFVQENCISHKVTFLGNHSNVPELLKDTDIFVLTSAWEGLPLSILEAMAHSLPIIASNVGGVKEAVRDSVNGYLICHNIAELLTILIENESLRKKMGEKSREIYEASFTFEKMYQKTISTYNNLIGSEENV